MFLLKFTLFLFFPVSLRMFARLWRFYFFPCVCCLFCVFVSSCNLFLFFFSFFVVVVVVKCFIWNRSEVFTNCFSFCRFFSLSLVILKSDECTQNLARGIWISIQKVRVFSLQRKCKRSTMLFDLCRAICLIKWCAIVATDAISSHKSGIKLFFPCFSCSFFHRFNFHLQLEFFDQ